MPHPPERFWHVRHIWQPVYLPVDIAICTELFSPLQLYINRDAPELSEACPLVPGSSTHASEQLFSCVFIIFIESLHSLLFRFDFMFLFCAGDQRCQNLHSCKVIDTMLCISFCVRNWFCNQLTFLWNLHILLVLLFTWNPFHRLKGWSYLFVTSCRTSFCGKSVAIIFMKLHVV